MTDEPTAEGQGGEVPDGAAILPEIPPELGIHPLLLAMIHAFVFLGGSEDEIVDPDAGEEALESMAAYLQRLQGPDLKRVREDLAALAAYGKDQGWPKSVIRFFREFLADVGVDGGETS